MTAKPFNRRQLLKGVTALGGLALASKATAQEALQSTAIRPADLSAAERIAGVQYTPTERAMIFNELEDMVDRVRKRRDAVHLGMDDEPATLFDPRLPGRTYKQQTDEIRIAAPEPMAIPGSDEAIAFAPLHAQAHWLKTEQISSSRLTDIYLKRIERIAPQLYCFVTVTPELAREQAYQADREIRTGIYRGSLHGIPYGMKDLIDTADTRTTWGAAPFSGRIAERDATVTKRLREAGAVLVGKTTLGALAYGDKWFGGTTRNPWNPDEGASGSSAGSASAVAAGLCSFTIGSETMGSIISPAERCGATGLRPTFGRVPRTGAMPLCWSLDKIGPLCRAVEDTALVLHAIKGADGEDPTCFDWGFAYDGLTAAAENLRIGYNPTWFEKEGTASDYAALSHLKEMGFVLTEVSLPDLPYTTLLSILEVEAAASFEELTLTGRDDELTWQEEAAWPNRLRAARFHTAVEIMQLNRFRRRVMEIFDTLYSQVDLIICPNYAGHMLIASNFTGHPSLTLPVGFENRITHPLTGVPNAKPGPEKLVPHGITLWGNLFREDQLLAVGALLERATNLAGKWPKL